MFHFFRTQGLCSLTRMLACALCSISLAVPSGSSAPVWHPWSFRDGSLVASEQNEQISFSFPYVPMLDQTPAWTPALPRLYQQPQEAILPWVGLGGTLQIGFIDESNKMTPVRKGMLSNPVWTPYSFQGQILHGKGHGKLQWFTPPDEKGIRFQFINSGTSEVQFGMLIQPFMQHQIWATPGKKDRHDWGIPQLSWSADLQAFQAVSGSPVDATHSPTSALWIGDATTTGLNQQTIEATAQDSNHLLKIKVAPQGILRFGFLHADNPDQLGTALKQIRFRPFSPEQVEGLWNGWLQDCFQRIRKTTGLKAENIPEGEKKLLETNLIQTRQLFLSNGGLLVDPITPERFDLSLPEQTVTLRHWRALGQEIPSLERWGELIRYNRMHNRSIDIPLLREGSLSNALQQGRIIMVAPDPHQPPTRDEFDTLLGYVIAGGHLTLVDGFAGFEQQDGWWRAQGAADPADYAIRKLNLPVDPASRTELDRDSLSAHQSPFVQGSTQLALATEASERRTVSITPPEAGGYLLLSPAQADQNSRATVYRATIGNATLVPYHATEQNLLEGSYGPQPHIDSSGRIIGANLSGPAFLAYRLPKDSPANCSVELEGNWRIGWTAQLPEQNLILRKKAFQSWYKSELLEMTVSRLCHPVVYSGTYTCRVFDITGTEQSPILFKKIGLGTFMWIGLPREAILLGSDTGSDEQNSLRKDPTYDLIRMTLAFHDPKRAGAERASQPPLSGWGKHWSWGVDGDPNPLWTWFAWSPIEQLGWGQDSMSSWVREDFLASLDFGSSEGLRLPHHALYSSTDHRQVDIATQAFLYALRKGMARVAEKTSQTWVFENSTRQAQMTLADISSVLPATGTTPIFGRKIEGLAVTEEIPLPDVQPCLAWAVTEIPIRDFPGGEDWRNRLLSAMVDHPSIPADPRSSAVLATCCPTDKRGHLLEAVLPRAGDGMLLIGSPGKSFDVVTAVPALHALVLKLAGK